jgi:adenylate kinase
MRSDNGVLYSRLTSRGYSGKKLEDNIEAEIMQLILDEARESYREEIVVELQSNTVEDLDSNVERTLSWLRSRTENRAAGSAEAPMEQSQPRDRCVM